MAKIIVTLPTFESTIRGILAEKEREAKAKKLDFIGIDKSELLQSVTKKFGDDWELSKPPVLHISEADSNSIASGRFFRKTGLKILMIWTILILGIAQSINWLPLIPYQVYYVLFFILTTGLVLIYSRKQNVERKALLDEFRKAGLIR